MPNRDGTGPKGRIPRRKNRWSSKRNLSCSENQKEEELLSFDSFKNIALSLLFLKTVSSVLTAVPALLTVVKKKPFLEDQSKNELIDLKTGKKVGYQIESQKIAEIENRNSSSR
jgi:hypothetical protein